MSDKFLQIQLQSTIGKVMEAMIHNQIIEHCNKFKLLHSAQHGFRNKHFTTSNLLELLNDLICYIGNGHSIDLITIDFSKAFDSVSHNKLIYKLKTLVAKYYCG